MPPAPVARPTRETRYTASWASSATRIRIRRTFSRARTTRRRSPRCMQSSSAIFMDTGDARTLRLRGVKVDAVMNTSFEDEQRGAKYQIQLWREWADLACPLPYYCPTGGSVEDALMHTLCWGMNHRGEQEEYRAAFDAWAKILTSADTLSVALIDCLWMMQSLLSLEGSWMQRWDATWGSQRSSAWP